MLKLNVFESSLVDYVMFWWFEPIAFHLILHIQRFYWSQTGTFMVSYDGKIYINEVDIIQEKVFNIFFTAEQKGVKT